MRAAQPPLIINDDDRVVRQAVGLLVHAGADPETLTCCKLAERGDERASMLRAARSLPAQNIAYSGRNSISAPASDALHASRSIIYRFISLFSPEPI